MSQGLAANKKKKEDSGSSFNSDSFSEKSQEADTKKALKEDKSDRKASQDRDSSPIARGLSFMQAAELRNQITAIKKSGTWKLR